MVNPALLLYINDLPSRVNIDTRCLLYRIIDGLEDQGPLELHLTTSELWFGQEQEGILP